MHINTWSMVLWGVLGIAFAEPSHYVQPIRDNVPVYATEVRPVFASPVFKAQCVDRLLVLAESSRKLQVKDGHGNMGWIEKGLVRSARGSQFIFQGMNVVPGHLDDPTIIFISGNDTRDEDPILLNRSFAEALRDNIDQEGAERAAPVQK